MMDNKEDLRDDLGLSPAETAIAADLRAAFLVEPDPATAERHIAAMVAAREAIRAPSVISLAGHRSRKAIAAAGLKEFWELFKAHLDAQGWSILAFGLVIASISAFGAIWGLLRILERFSAWPFVVYRALIGVFLLLAVFVGWLPN